MGSNNITHDEALSILRNKIEEYRRSIVNSEIRIATIENLITEIEDNSKMLGMIGKPIKRNKHSEYKDDFIPLDLYSKDIPGYIGNVYSYNKQGVIRDNKTCKSIKRENNSNIHKISVDSIHYVIGMSECRVLASTTIYPNDILFKDVVEACEYFKCKPSDIIRCIKSKDRHKEYIKGYTFHEFYPEPYIVSYE